MRDGEFESYDLLGLAHLIRSKQIDAEQLLEVVIARIEKLNPAINAITYTFYDRARDQIRKGPADGIFSGVPFLLKD